MLGIDATPAWSRKRPAWDASRFRSARWVTWDGFRCETAALPGSWPPGCSPTCPTRRARSRRWPGWLTLAPGWASSTPISRHALAARHRERGADAHDMNIDPHRIGPLLAEGGWTLELLDDADDHYLALAVCDG